jgi:enoyl-CoA hydratase/carnithine racemase
MEFADGKILADIKDGVGRITFNQPEKRNAMSVAMWDGMGQALDEFEKDASVRCVVLTGAGDKAFVSGADISQFDKMRSDADAQKEYGRLTAGGRLKLASYAKPVIAEIRGFCMGGGLGIAMSCDIRIAAEGSQFGIPAAKLGIAYGFDMVKHLVSLVGPATLAQNAPLSLFANKRTVQAVLQDRTERDIAAINAAMNACFDSADYKEGRKAFMEKRKPAFQGR